MDFSLQILVHFLQRVVTQRLQCPPQARTPPSPAATTAGKGTGQMLVQPVPPFASL